jgi:hypothetical protein
MTETTDKDNYARRMLEALIEDRLSNKLIYMARVVDPNFDARVLARWPGLVKPLGKA